MIDENRSFLALTLKKIKFSHKNKFQEKNYEIGYSFLYFYDLFLCCIKFYINNIKYSVHPGQFFILTQQKQARMKC